jgi:anti-anti-sigma regulatory factor
MTLKIEKDSDGRKVIIRPSGRLQYEHLEELEKQLIGEPAAIGIDLEGVTLVDVKVIRFLNVCEDNGVDIIHCWPYIREWMIREKQR